MHDRIVIGYWVTVIYLVFVLDQARRTKGH